MLPDFPAVKERRAALIQLRAHIQAMEKHPLLQMMPARPVPEGKDFAYKTVHGEDQPGGFHHLQAKLEIDKAELPLLNDDRWVEKCAREMIEPIVSQQMELLIDTLKRVTAETGNVLDAKGASIPDSMLQMLDRIGFSFDEAGQPQFPVMLVGTDMYEKVKALGEPTDDFKKRQQEIVERKWTEWRLEQADRQLVS